VALFWKKISGLARSLLRGWVPAETIRATRGVRVATLTIIILSLVGRDHSPHQVLAQEPASSRIETVSVEPVVVQADERGVRLRWALPPPQVATVEVDGVLYTRITVAGLVDGAAPGFPQLPGYKRFIALPPTGDATLNVISASYDTLTLDHPPLPASGPGPSLRTDDDLPVSASVVIEPDPTLYNINALLPANGAELGSVVQVRGHRLLPVRIHPVRVNPVTREAVLLTAIELEVIFDQPAPDVLSSQDKDDQPSAPFEQALAVTLLNPEGTRWDVTERSSPVTPPLQTSDATGLTKIVVRDRGLHQLTYNTLAGAGLPVDSLDPRTLLISYGPDFTPVPVLVEGEADGVFNTGDRLLFYAEPVFSRYTDEDVYFISYDATSPPRMTARSGDPQGLPSGTLWRTTTAESNVLYRQAYPGRDGDYWYWQAYNTISGGLETADYNINVTHPASGGPAATLTVWVQRDKVASQEISVRLNGASLGNGSWSSTDSTPVQFTIAPALLRAGSNTVRVQLESSSTMLLDAIELTYPTSRGGSNQSLVSGGGVRSAYTLSGWSSADLHVLDVTTPLTPTVLTGTHYAAGTLTLADSQSVTSTYLIVPNSALKSPVRLEPARIMAPPAGAEYIIITHPDFSSAIEPLALHRAKTLDVFTVDTQTVYDSYGGGRMSPQAIRAFLQDAFLTWNPAPEYVLLVGDGSYDPKDHTGFDSETYLPPFLAPVDPWQGNYASGGSGDAAADNRFVTFGVDNFPSLSIGRLPVNSAAETTIVVNKIIQYESDPFPGDWNMSHLFVGGDYLDGSEPPSRTDTFHSHATAAFNTIVPPFVGYRFYYNNILTSSHESYYYTDHVALREAFIRAFNRGAGVVVFHGHSSVHQWNDQPLLRWSKVSVDNDINTLYNDRRLPVVLSMTCFTSYFHHPEFPTLDESLLRRNGGGAVATWGATGLGVATGHKLLQAGFYAGLNGGNTTLGAAVLAGKSELYDPSSFAFDQDLLDTFTLFGDPAMPLNLTYLPFSNRQYVPVLLK
jgi:hypothetical protein